MSTVFGPHTCNLRVPNTKADIDLCPDIYPGIYLLQLESDVVWQLLRDTAIFRELIQPLHLGCPIIPSCYVVHSPLLYAPG